MRPEEQLVTFTCNACGEATDRRLDEMIGADEFVCPNMKCGHSLALPASFVAEGRWLLQRTGRALRRRQGVGRTIVPQG